MPDANWIPLACKDSHTWNSGKVTTKATCTEAGEKTYTCQICQNTKTEVVAAQGHTPVTDKSVAATSASTGLTEGSHCSICGEILKRQEVLPAIVGNTTSNNTNTDQTHGGTTGSGNTSGAGNSTVSGNASSDTTPGTPSDAKPNKPVVHTHTFSAYKVTKKATAVTTGVQTRTCTVCGKTETNVIQKLKATIKLSKTKFTLKKGKSVALKISKLAKGDSVKTVKTSKKSVATVKKLKKNQYKITAKNKGSAKITVTLKSGLKKVIKVTVK